MVGSYEPSLSDHCPLIAKIRTATNIAEEIVTPPTLHDLPSRYIWKDGNTETFEEKLDSDDFRERVNKILATADNEDLARDVQHLLTHAADECNIKKTRRSNRKIDPPWFDEECREIKNRISGHGKKLRQQPDNTETREKLYFDKKKLRNLVRKKTI